jgi:hypothetical protein
MDYFTLKVPVAAVRYRYPTNEKEVLDLIAATGRTGHSFNNSRGYLHIYNSGPELAIQDGQWAVAVGDDVTILSHERFTELFDAAAAS